MMGKENEEEKELLFIALCNKVLRNTLKSLNKFKIAAWIWAWNINISKILDETIIRILAMDAIWTLELVTADCTFL